ncbi:MAG: FdtA/QdtA family cupin domain-containing protein [Cytophagaceae bacterium]|nr:FdtA/QdtA family cupin domain-containing protein [Cytophagaceae bacterium]
MMSRPRLIDFQQIGEPEIGYISVAQSFQNIPFVIKRVYWVYDTPADVERGNHANKEAEHVLVSLKGAVNIYLEDIRGNKYDFLLNNPNQGLYIPALHWRRLKMDPEVVCLSLSSSDFHEPDYIREYADFLALK